MTLSQEMKILYCVLFFIGFTSLASAQQELYSDSISVHFFLLDECRICQYYGPLLKEYHEEFASETISFKGYFPNFSSKKDQIDQFKEDNQVPFDLKTDYFKKRSRKYDLRLLPTVIVYDEKKKQLLYKGRIDNRFYGVGKQRQVTTRFDLKSALDSIVNQQPIKEKSTQAVGCFINFADNISKSQ